MRPLVNGDSGDSNVVLYDKVGNVLASTDFEGLFLDAGGFAADPWVICDRYSDRFVATVFNHVSEIGTLEIAISKSRTPVALDANDWHQYSISGNYDFVTDELGCTDSDDGALIDFPKIAADADGLYITANYTPINSGNDFRGVLVTNAAHKDDWRTGRGIRIWEMDQTNDVLTEKLILRNTGFQSHVEATTSGLPIDLGASQDGTPVRLQTFFPIMNAVWRNNSIWTTHTVEDANGDAAVRWYEIDTTGGAYTVTQTADIKTAAGVETFMPSIAVDAVGNMAITYSERSGSKFVQMRFATHEATDPLNTSPARPARSGRPPPAGTGRQRAHSARSTPWRIPFLRCSISTRVSCNRADGLLT